MKAETAAKPTTLSANVPPGPIASREMNGPIARRLPCGSVSGRRVATAAPSSGAPAANAQTSP